MKRAFAVSLFLAACSPTPSPTTPKPIAATGSGSAVVEPEPAPQPDPVPPELRLPDTVRPTHYNVELTIDPSREDFTGKIDIDLDVRSPTTVVWLNQEEIAIERAEFALANGAKLTGRVVSPITDFVAIVTDKPLPAGKARLAIAYAGKMHRSDGTGLYPVEEAGQWYAFTQFESQDAREAFPCFDEPSYKVPWKLAIRHKQGAIAIANTKPLQTTAEANGWQRTEFAETKPLPSYLVAFAVGPFDFVDAGATRNGTPMRIVVPKGRGGEATYAAANTRPIVDRLEDYFGMPYPYDKLDLVAVPVFNAGAMENPGLITYRQAILVVKPGELTQGRQENFAQTTAHELAHQWFGDYVTLAWWDDTWLNEAFASWMGAKIVAEWKPEWDGEVDAVASKGGIMGSDSLDTARSIHNEITTKGDIEASFDGITYAKGGAVLAMIERHVTPEKFRAGVRKYLADHAWGNASYGDFVAAMTHAVGADMRPIFDTFVKQSGVPLVSFELACAGGKATVQMSQRRYVPTGSQIKDTKRTWHIPVCLKWNEGTATRRTCEVLTSETGSITLPTKTCPAWLLTNEGGMGYYRSSFKGTLLDQLLAQASKQLTLPERIGLLSDVNALVGNGEIANGVALQLVDQLARDKSPHIVDESVSVVAGIEDMVTPELQTNYQRLIKRLYRKRAVELGFASKPGEDDKIKSQRATLIGLVAGTGRDPELIKEATALGIKWLDDHKAVEPELARTVLAIAARNGDSKLFDRIYKDAKAAKDREERGRLLAALGSFEDPKLVARTLEITLTDDFDIREWGGLLQGAFSRRATRELAYKFVTEHVDQVADKMPQPYRPYLVFTFVPFCDASRKAEFDKFWRPRMDKLDRGKALDQALEALTLCSAQRAAQTPGVVAFLKRQ